MLDEYQIAEVCHEANRALQKVLGEDNISEHWDNISSEMATSAEEGVSTAINGASPEELHESWCLFKTSNGWTYGETKDEEAKTHPCLVSYDKLPESQKLKDYLFSAVVNALKDSDI